ncbi:site-specific DNA methylase [Caudoviricetes sp.]|nr:site-specific DNA methylase [Caudoviricetes sp.]
MKLKPFFKHFGSKWQSAYLYPAPEFPVIHEPFAGGAGYSLNYADRNVLLFDTDPQIRDLWRWLIHDATESLVREIPLDFPEGYDLRTSGLSYHQALLCKKWQRTFDNPKSWTISSWGNKPGQWTESSRNRVAEQISAIRHWRFLDVPYGGEATHFVDPPYIGNYDYKQPPINFEILAANCRSAPGQVIVCEGLGKDGSVPTWLPFEPLAERVTCRRKASQSHHRMEYIWTNKKTTT